MAEKDPRVLRD